MKFIGARLLLDSGTLTPLLKRLEARGLIHRERARHDEREVLVRLSLDGIELKEQARHIPLQILCQASVPPNRILALKDELRAILNADAP